MLNWKQPSLKSIQITHHFCSRLDQRQFLAGFSAKSQQQRIQYAVNVLFISKKIPIWVVLLINFQEKAKQISFLNDYLSHNIKCDGG